MHKKYFGYAGFLGVLALGIGLRLGNLSDYLVYPDSYTALVVADHIRAQGHTVASLGAGGLMYPGFFDWTRPLYPALVALVTSFGASLAEAGRLVSLLAGIAAIPAAAWLVYELTRKQLSALMAAGLVALSYAGVVWSGFVLTETLGNLMLLVSAAWIVRQSRRPVAPLDWRDGLTGVLLAGTILTRYEYALLAPLAIAMSAPRYTPARWLSIAAGSAVVLVPSLIILLGDAATTDIAVQLGMFWPYLLGGTAAVALAATWWFRRPAHPVRRPRSVAVAALAVLAVIALAPAYYPGLARFIGTDPLLTLLAAIGFIIMAGQASMRGLLAVSLAGMTLLALAYGRYNPDMARYGAHLLPFLVTPAAYAVVAVGQLTRRWQYAAYAGLSFAVIGQANVSAAGLHGDGGVWFRPGYEQQAAGRASPRLPPASVVFAALPEPYYLASRHPTQSFTMKPPYLYAPGLAPSTPVVVVRDQALTELFPAVDQALSDHLLAPPFATFAISEPFRYITAINEQPAPIRLYALTFGELQAALLHQ